jgi:hypothetical protein
MQNNSYELSTYLPTDNNGTKMAPLGISYVAGEPTCRCNLVARFVMN